MWGSHSLSATRGVVVCQRHIVVRIGLVGEGRKG